MKELKVYVCEKCEKEFNLPIGCLEHEEHCNTLHTFICDKCGKVMQWYDSDINAEEIKNQCHYINLGRLGYGSDLDGCDVNFNLCDECLCQFINTFINKNKIIYSGTNLYGDVNPYEMY